MSSADSSYTAAVARLAAKHEELREPCRKCCFADGFPVTKSRPFQQRIRLSNGQLSDTEWEPCSKCRGLGYVPLSGPALLTGLVALAKQHKTTIYAPGALVADLGGLYNTSSDWWVEMQEAEASGDTLEAALARALDAIGGK